MQTFSHLYNNSAWNCLRQSVKEEGFFGLYRGLMAPIAAQGLVNALLFTGESIAMTYLEPNLNPGEVGKPSNVFLAGSFGGFLSCFCIVPSDIIKCNMQINMLLKDQRQYTGIIDCGRQIYRTEGLKGYYKGFFATCAREIPSLGVYFSVYRHTSDFLTPDNTQTSTLVTLFSGGLAGSASWASVYPIDV